MNLNDHAKTLQEARLQRRAIAPLSSTAPLTLEDGYAIQEIGREMRLAEGERMCGYKMGLTSRAKQRDVQVFEPIRGYLLQSMEIGLGQPIETAGRIHPRIEPEVAVTFKSVLKGRVTLRDVLRSLEAVYPAAEILDSRFEAFSFRLPDVVADNTSASGFVIGSRNLLPEIDELGLFGITVRKNGEVAETGTPAAVLGNPLLAVVDLVNGLAREGKGVEPGMVCLTGGITASVTLAKGDWVEMLWPGETLTFNVI